MGRSKPRTRRALSRSDALAPGATQSLAGSPGARFISRKVIVRTRTISPAATLKRRKILRNIENCWSRTTSTSSAGLVGGMLLVVFACGSCGPSPRSQTATVLFASGADLQSINPLIAVHPLAKQVQKHVLFLTLAVYDRAMQPVPRLASWSWNAARDRLEFRLRNDVWWHDGPRTTAGDVKWTFDMARSPAMAYPRARELADVADVVQVDSLTLEIAFVRSQPLFPDVLTDLAILPKHHFEGMTAAEVRTAVFNRRPIGNGPFEFMEYRPNQRWVFRRAASFPEELGRPRIERIVIVVVDEATTKLAALTSGELDFAGINPAHASFVRSDPRLTVVDYPVQFVNGLIWNLRRQPFDDPRVRRALTLALDRELLVNAYVYGFGVVADGPVSPNHTWFVSPAAVPYNPDEASALLDQAGFVESEQGGRWRDGTRLELELLTVGSADNALEQMIQSQLDQVGVGATIRQMELAAFLSTVQGDSRDFDAVVTLVPGDFSLGHVAALFGGENSGPLAYSGYRSDEFDAALERGRKATTIIELGDAWREAQQVLSDDLPVTWLYHARGVLGANRRIRGVRMDLRGELATVADWWISEDGESR